VRELINVVERAVLLAEGEEITVGDLPEDVQASALTAVGAGPVAPSAGAGRDDGTTADGAARLTDVPLQQAREKLVEAFEREYLERMLQETQGRIGEAADRAGITSRSLYEKMKRLGLRKEAFKPSTRRSQVNT